MAEKQPDDPYASARSKPVKLRSLGESWVGEPPPQFFTSTP